MKPFYPPWKTPGRSCAIFGMFLAWTFTAAAATVTVTFDDILNTGSHPIANGYAGFQWDNFWEADYTWNGDSGFRNAVVSERRVAYNAYGDPAQISRNTPFNILSAYLTGVWNDGLNVQIRGFNGTNLLYDNVFTIDSTAPSLINLNYFGVTRIHFLPSGGVNHGWRGFGGGGDGPVFAMDNLTLFTCAGTVPPVLVGVPTNQAYQCIGDVPPLASVTATNIDGSIPVTTICITNGVCPTIITCTWRAQDRCTNIASATRTITVLDTIPPVLVGVPTNQAYQCFGDVPPPANVTATDNCDGAIPVTTTYVTNGVCPTIITCTWRAQDRCTNSASATRTITVLDTIPPVLVGVPGNTNLECLSDVPPPAQVMAFDNCDGAIPVTTTYVTNGSCPKIITCTWRAQDRCTNSASATRTIVIGDTGPPFLGCPPNLIARSVAELPPCPGSLSAFLAAGGTASDLCDTNLAYGCADGPLAVNGCLRTVSRTHTVIDACTNRAACVQVFTINHPPDCVAGITPAACGPAFGDLAKLFVISLNHVDACLILDGSLTTDPENDPLTFVWSEGSNLLGTTAVVTNCLPLGCHTLTFTASDCVESCSKTLDVCVITACEAVEQCIVLVDHANLDRQSKRPLIASLKAACASFERDSLTSGLNQLQAFQNKLRAQLSRTNPVEAQVFAVRAQQIIDAIGCAARLNF